MEMYEAKGTVTQYNIREGYACFTADEKCQGKNLFYHKSDNDNLSVCAIDVTEKIKVCPKIGKFLAKSIMDGYKIRIYIIKDICNIQQCTQKGCKLKGLIFNCGQHSNWRIVNVALENKNEN